MANYANLLAQIAANIYSNNNQEITGDGLQAVLSAMVASLGAGYQFMDVATPATNPGMPDQNVFYLCGPGVYPNFGGIAFGPRQFGILKYNGSWQQETIDISGFNSVSEDGWFLVDELLNVALKYDADGLDAAKVSDHFVELLKAAGIGGDSPALSSFALTNEPGFAIVDPLLNIGVKVDQLGIHSQSILEFEIVNS